MSNSSFELSITRRILSCLCAGFFFFFTIFQKVTFNVISNDLMTHFHLSSTSLGAISSAYLYANALWLIPGGVLLERFSARRVTILFTLLCALSSIVFAYSDSIFLDIVMRFIAGLGSAMSLLISLRLSARLFPNCAARVTGLLVSLGMSAGFFANAPFLYLVQHIGWQHGLLAIGGFGLLLAIFMSLFLFDKSEKKPATRFKLSELLNDIKTVVKHKENLKLGTYIGLMNLPIFILGSLWGGLFLIHTGSISISKAAFIISMIFVGEITGAPIIGWISDQLNNRKQVMIIGAIFSLVISSFILNVANYSGMMLSCLFFLLGFTLSAQVIGYSVIAENNNPKVISTASGFGSFIVNMFGAFCQVLFPLLLKIGSDTSTASHYKIAYLMFPVAFLLAISVANSIKEKSNASVFMIDSVTSDETLLSQP